MSTGYDDLFQDVNFDERSSFSLGFNYLKNLQLYMKRRAQLEEDYVSRLGDLNASLKPPHPCWINELPSTIDISASTAQTINAHRSIASCAQKVFNDLNASKQNYKQKLADINTNFKAISKAYSELRQKTVPNLKKEYHRKSQISDADNTSKGLKLQNEAKQADLQYRKGLQELEEKKMVYNNFVKQSNQLIESLEAERITRTKECIVAFSQLEMKNANDHVQIFASFMNSAAKIDVDSELQLVRRSFAGAWPVPPIVLYEHPQFNGSLSYLVFGVPLEFNYLQTNRDIPCILENSFDAIEKRGIDKEGIYRLSGKHKDVNDLRLLLEKDPNTVNLSDESSTWDINVVAGVVKMYLRELPEPLFPFPVADRADYSQLNETERIARLRSMYRVIGNTKLGKVKQRVLKYIIEHLGRIASHSDKNKMTPANLSLIFGPMLFDHSDALAGGSGNGPEWSGPFGLFKSQQQSQPTLSQLEVFKQNVAFEDMIVHQDRILVLEIPHASRSHSGELHHQPGSHVRANNQTGSGSNSITNVAVTTTAIPVAGAPPEAQHVHRGSPPRRSSRPNASSESSIHEQVIPARLDSLPSNSAHGVNLQPPAVHSRSASGSSIDSLSRQMGRTSPTRHPSTNVDPSLDRELPVLPPVANAADASDSVNGSPIPTTSDVSANVDKLF